MNKTIFRQYKGSWATKPYPTKKCTVAGAGCGLLALTHIAIEQEAKKNWTPETLRPYMLKHGFAIAGQGTTWNGITKTLHHLGYEKVTYITESTPMKTAFEELNKGNRIGIFLFYGGYSKRKKKWYRTPDGTVWTSSGHYIMFGNYKYENGKHWFYLKDSGGRKHDGWYSYESSMKGCVGQMWIVERTGVQTTSQKAVTSDGKLVVDGIGGTATVKALQKLLKGVADGLITGQDKNLKRYYPALKAVSFSSKPKGSPTIKLLQTALGISPDGILGKTTVTALQKFLGVKADGVLGKATMKALQSYLNNPTRPITPPPSPVKPTPAPTPTPTPVPAPAVKSGYTGIFPLLHVKMSSMEVRKAAVKWGKMIAKDNSFHYGKGKDAHHNGCHFCNTQPKIKKKSGIKDPDKTYCCNPFAHACYAHGGLFPPMLKLCQKGSSYGFKKSEGYAKSKYFKYMGKLKNPEIGDVCCSDRHVGISDGKGHMIQAGHEDDNDRNSKSWNSSISSGGTWNGYTRVYRFIGSVDDDIPMRYGEYSDRIVHLQKYLNWYFGREVCKPDGIFGPTTLKYVKAFQTAQKIAADGIVGAGTLAKMKGVVK